LLKFRKGLKISNSSHLGKVFKALFDQKKSSFDFLTKNSLKTSLLFLDKNRDFWVIFSKKPLNFDVFYRGST
jgi:hypothetical protein